MTTTSTRAGGFDTGPLSWVIGEIRDALARSGNAVRDAAGRSPEAQPTLLLHAKTHLHQAHGALQMVDVEGVGAFTGAAEQLLDRLKDGQLPCTEDNARLLQDAYGALGEYLDELLAGAPQQPARLFPYFRDLQERLGVQRIHPSDLLMLDLSVLPDLPFEGDAGPVDVAACRARFEKSLLPYLKSTDPEQVRLHAAGMAEAIAPVAAGQQDPRARLFWQAMHAFAAVVAEGQVESDLYAKQLFGQINLQARRLSQGQGGTPDAMLRDALFFVAAAPAPGPEAQRLRRALHLEGAVPPDYAERRYGKIDPAALKEAREALARTKSDWDRIAHEADAVVEDDFNDALAQLAGASEKLGAPALAQLLRELGRAATDSMSSGRSDQFGLEMAAAMLFVENGLDQLRQLPQDFAENAEAVGARLLALAAGETPPDAAHWQGELARQIQQGQTVAVLANEIKTGLRQIEKLLDEYYDDPGKRQVLEQSTPVLHQLQGAFAILDLEQAVRATQHVAGEVRKLADYEGDVTSQHAALHNIAQNIGALGFFADLLAQDSEAAKGRFTFDEDKRLLRELPYEFVEPASEPAQEASAPVETSIEAELLEIFIGEAQEVLGLVAEHLPRAADDPGNQETLTLLRRSFHTLKGSSRMVELEDFAATSAAVERVMNVWLSDSRPASAGLLALLAHAHAELEAWVADLAAGRTPARDGAALVEAAARVQEGGPFEAPATLQAEAPALLDDEIPVLDQQVELPAAQGARDGIRRIGGLEVPEALYHIYLAEAEQLLQALAAECEAWRAAPRRTASDDGLKAVHTLAGTSGTVGYHALRDVAQALELTLDKLAAPGAYVEDAELAVLDTTLARMRTMLQVFGLGELAPEQPDLIDQLAALRERVASRQAASVYGEADPALAQQLDALFAAAYDSLVAAPPAFEAPAAAPAAKSAPDTSEVDDVFDLFLDDPFAAPALDQAAPALASAMAPPVPVPDIEEFVPELDETAFVAVTPDEAVLLEPEPEHEPESPAGVQAEMQAEMQAGPQEDVEPVLAAVPVFADELDPDLLPVFLEEATDLLPQIGNGLRQWQQHPQDMAIAQGLQRALHTVKGSARMAGAMRLGQHTHELETEIENLAHAGSAGPAAFDELLASYDQALLLFEQLQQPQAAAQPKEALAAPAPAEQPGARQPLVRVRADLLDRVVNQAGEVSITRSKLETQVETIKGSLNDFSDNVARLRRQLREIEMQAESQIASRLSIAGEREFDPLEFDRFTRLQELTRMLAESVNDVASFQETIGRTVDSAAEELAAQSRLTRDLQRDLMRVRMVPFASLSERLFRVARQTAKETDKRVNLDIRGGAVEVDRGVLEQMAAPFEHLLRNAIVHGIEPRAVRQAAGKPETGDMLVQVSQHGNEVVMQFSDDGAGLDLERIRAKAIALGLLGELDEVSDQDAAELIFEPGFSTADTLTELAGRGVGMDVVRSEAQALGGRVAVDTTPGQGTRFTIHLPLTLAVAQVVLVTNGGRSYAIPATLVEQMLQVRDTELEAALHEGKLAAGADTLALHELAELLGEEGEPLPLQRSNPVMVLNSGSRRIALRIGEVVGNREVVVKNIGPQLARVPGIAGATVLGSGEIVLILDPVALAQQPHKAQRAQPQAAPQAPLPLVMVVDDSITVRKVTQRLLEREGYRVLLAKDGVEALELVAQGAPDLMLVDIEMPRMDGFDLTRQIRGSAATQAVPIIMITSRTADKHRNYALGLGVNAYFGKPYQEEVLLAAIGSLLGREAA
ncbi:Hpt domain-containing protein [Massilia sp. ST3]|uniref:hybrid sensor histidine kinase/response regulator n=1 Tax=Massilia sp. ST3 TaxID=2824903 RepID=UPI001B821CFB|nr:Hpt domain-containing protein [Massilia sp. ST3]MBQ5950259.1 Hpt domain-containing protein [Massilia sp. ST3]